MNRYLHKPTPAMAVALLALIVALGGTSYAAFGPFGGDKIIKKHSLSGNRLRLHTLTGNQINLSKLGKVPNATNADVAKSTVFANSADTAKSADTANTATTATTATNANNLGGQPPSAYQGKGQWALIDGTTGNVLAQSGGISVADHSTPGFFYLEFGSSVASRPVSVTYGGVSATGTAPTAAVCGGAGPPEGVTCAKGANDTTELLVTTYDATGAAAKRDFFVTVGTP